MEKQCDGPNEEFSSCVKSFCSPGRKCPAVCKPGCVCKKSFVRENGLCVRGKDEHKIENNIPFGKFCFKYCSSILVSATLPKPIITIRPKPTSNPVEIITIGPIKPMYASM